MTLIHHGVAIPEAASATGLSGHTLRHEERAGLMLALHEQKVAHA